MSEKTIDQKLNEILDRLSKLEALVDSIDEEVDGRIEDLRDAVNNLSTGNGLHIEEF